MTNENFMNTNNFHSEMIKDMIEENLGCKFNSANKYIICIQGISSSGKSVFAETLGKYLTENGINTQTIHLDAYYFKQINPEQDESKYDYDNPASLDWDGIFDLFGDIVSNKETLTQHVYSKNCNDPVIIKKIPNPYANVIIVEGVFAFNIVSDQKFNITEFDVYNSSKKIKNEYTKNKLNFDNFKILKIMMTQCYSKFFSIRVQRDIERGRIKSDIENRIVKFTWPDALKWVYQDINRNYIKLVHGCFNKKMSSILISELCRFFLRKYIKPVFIFSKNYENEFNVKCSKECSLTFDSVVLLDDIY